MPAILVFALLTGGPAARAEDAGGLDWGPWRRLPVLDGGRIMPLDTFARGTVEKISGGRAPRLVPSGTAAEVLLSWLVEPEKWEDVPFLPAADPVLRELLDVPLRDKAGRRPDGISPRQVQQAVKLLVHGDKEAEDLLEAYTSYRMLTFHPAAARDGRGRFIDKPPPPNTGAAIARAHPPANTSGRRPSASDDKPPWRKTIQPKMAAAGKVARQVKAPRASRPRDVSMGVPLLACPAGVAAGQATVGLQRPPSCRGPDRQGDQQEQSFESRDRRRGNRDRRGKEQSQTHFRHRPPEEIKGQSEEEPKSRIADHFGTPTNHFAVHGVKEAAGQGDAIVELPPQPAVKRQHDQPRPKNAPKVAGQFPIQAGAVQQNQGDRQRVEPRLLDRLRRVAFVQRLGQANVVDAVGTQPAQLPRHDRPRDQAEDQKQNQSLRGTGFASAACGLLFRLGDTAGRHRWLDNCR